MAVADNFTLKLLRSVTVDAEDVLREIEEVAPSKGLPIIGPAKGVVLDEVVRSMSPKAALEVGTLVGYSAIRIARLLPTGGKLTCLEVSPDLAAVARSNLEKTGLQGRVEIVVGDAKKVLPGLRGTVDFILIDAKKDEYLTYLQSAEHLLHPGSTVVADNVKTFADEVRDYLDYVRTSGRYSSRYVEVPLNADPSQNDALEISVRL